MPTINDITVAILTYRRPDLLKRCLHSIASQTHQPRKILVIDSYRLKKNIPKCRNLALKKCRTRYLAFIDDDCIAEKSWLSTAYNSIRRSPQTAFVVGKTLLLNNRNPLATVQYHNYLQWFKETRTLDTKNLILDLHQIKGISFDTKFKIFEDIDFSLQLKSHHLIGKYEPKMRLHHPEVSSIFKAIKKNYLRGQFKAKITQKWGEYDNYSPTLPSFTNLVDFTFKVAFMLGYLKNPPRPITIINQVDHGANSKRLTSVYNFLTKNHHFVKVIDPHTEFQKVIASRRYLLIYGFTLLKYRLLKWFYESQKQDIGPKLLTITMQLKSLILHRLLQSNRTYLAIIQNPEAMLVASLRDRSYKTLYDSPTIFFRELELTSNYSAGTIDFVRSSEIAAYRYSDYTSFHWYTYFKIAREYSLKIKHPLTLNWGCETVSQTTNYHHRPKIIHLGKLNSYWVNPKLLSYVASNTTLDIYSYEKPEPNFYPTLRGFKGFLPNESTVAKYQFGLITLSKDDLRSSGFSAKYLLYLSYGLPVLCPEWRYDPLLSPATIYYNETNIKQIIEKYRDPVLWQKKHLSALKLSNKLNWNNTLKKLLTITHE